MDTTFKSEEGVFNFRVGAIIKKNNCYLMTKGDQDDYYFSVGGRVHLGETTEDAVIREAFEETGQRFVIKRLSCIHENFFKIKGTFYHEVCFYYELGALEDLNLMNMDYVDAGNFLHLAWIDFHKKSVKTYPDFFLSLDNTVKHIITRE